VTTQETFTSGLTSLYYSFTLHPKIASGSCGGLGFPEESSDSKKKLYSLVRDNRFEILCETLDFQIDEVVQELYGLTEEEIMIVEGKFS
jgi:hypothetical protein